ncbi:RNA 2',3'-cyclic phosphodiesterase [Halorubrum vacuolatum]|uniref:RNA 2',3'-cyclic phosphodiesterase n=1 Tax=Halorubrum vacuolatum TaxID=63740 RepID=A0A238XXI0_HALVU|nr:RNA 2',3'-cyclic phosphodiesterase [Halorubrum vacuolatum]SNR63221.1 2'-5' RNA ligase [Halorubrum vacuolatum]
MRAFFAVDLPESLTDAIAAAQGPLTEAAGIDPVDPEGAHLTLKFLGEVDDGDHDGPDDGDHDGPDADVSLDDVLAAGERAVERAGVDPFACRVRGYGVFPSLEYISVVWAGIEEGGEELTELHEALEAETTAIGVDAETHAFTPHVTIARMRDGRGKEHVQRVVHEREPEIGRFEANEIRLLSSTLTPDGPLYEPVEVFDL